MHKKKVIAGICGMLLWALAAADVDLTDFDDDVMRTIGETVKALEADIAANDEQAAISDAGISRQGLQYAETYFISKGNAPDAVRFAQASRTLSDEILQALRGHDAQKAMAATHELTRSCERCHNVYKPF